MENHHYMRGNPRRKSALKGTLLPGTLLPSDLNIPQLGRAVSSPDALQSSSMSRTDTHMENEPEQSHLELRRKKSKVVPCVGCREKHLKCDYQKPTCGRCKKAGEECVRGTPKIKFRHGSSARHDSGFSKDQTWLKTSVAAAQLDYVDETAEIAAFYAHNHETADSDTELNLNIRERAQSNSPPREQNDVHTSLLQRPGAMGPPGSTRGVSHSAESIRSPLKRRKTSESRYVRDRSQDNDAPDSIRALSPGLSWLNLSSPVHNINRSSTASLNFIAESNFALEEESYSFRDTRFSQSTSPRYNLTPINSASARLENVPSTPVYAASPYSPNLHRPPSQAGDTMNDTWTWKSPTLRESILMRYFTENLAHWFDLCDQERHFQLVVPQRARHCRPLLNAIFTTSARHLTRLSKYKVSINIDGIRHEVVSFAGNVLPDLKTETAIQYHNESIKDLIGLSMDPDHVHNENLLAAAIILRYYEEVDAPLRAGTSSEELVDESVEGIDSELFLKVTNTFLNAQQPAMAQLPHTSPVAINNLPGHSDSFDNTSFPVFYTSPSSMATPPNPPSQHHRNSSTSMSDLVPRPPRADGLRQACFWVAFRQEIAVAFLKQRPFRISLASCSAFRSFSAAEDAVWADRLIIFCADVLDFCHGTNDLDASSTINTLSGSDIQSHRGRREERDRWNELQATLKQFSTVLPKSFEPIYFRPPDPAHGEVFPEIWYLDAVHVTGIQHVELARILLAASNPSMPKLGPGYVAAMIRLSSELKAIVLRLCGIALSNRRTPPGLVTAYMGIAMCGEHFSERLEQEALVEVLKELETEHAWPTEQTASMLKKAWGWVD